LVRGGHTQVGVQSEGPVPTGVVVGEDEADSGLTVEATAPAQGRARIRTLPMWPLALASSYLPS